MEKKLICITIAKSRIEAEQIISFLKENGIFAVMEGGIQELYTGDSVSGEKIMISSANEEKARKLLQSFTPIETRASDPVKQTTKTQKIINRALLGIIVVIFLLTVAGLAYNFYFSDSNELTPITLEEFEQYVHTPDTSRGDTFYIYVGRDDCPDCAKIHPAICELASEDGMDILYYSTSQDRETRQERMSTILDEVKVDSVPTILEFTKGQLSASYSGDEFVENSR